MNFFKKLFGGKPSAGSVEDIIDSSLSEIFTLSSLDLTAHTRSEAERIVVEIEGGDTELLKEKDGQLLDALQFLLKRIVQHQFPDERVDLEFDTNGFREESNQALIELAERLKGVALEKGKSVYIRALAPKDRKVIHQHLAGDERVKSKSIGDGHYKKIKIFPVNMRRDSREETAQTVES